MVARIKMRVREAEEVKDIMEYLLWVNFWLEGPL